MQESVSLQAEGSAPARKSVGRRLRIAVDYAPHALILLAVLTGFGYVWAFGVNVFFGDEWDSLPGLLAGYRDAGRAPPAELWRQNNEHRVFVPKLVMLGVLELTAGNVVANMYLSEVLLAATLAVYLAIGRRQFRGPQPAWLLTPMALLLFSLRQYDNMLWGFQLAFVMVVFWAALAFFGLSRVRNERCALAFVLAALAAAAGSFSSLQGILIWPAGLGQLIIAPLGKRLKIILTAAWAALGGGAWLLYFHGWTASGPALPWAFSWKYFLVSLGGSLSSNETVALSLGVVLLSLTAAAAWLVFRRRQWSAQSFWLATAAFSLATLAMIAVGRSGFGPHHALASRYSTFSLPLAIAVYAIFTAQIEPRPGWLGRAWIRTALVVAFLSAIVGLAEGLRIGRKVKLSRQRQQFVVRTLDRQPNEAIEFCGLGEPGTRAYAERSLEIRRLAAAMRRLRCNAYADAEPTAQRQPAALKTTTLR